MVRIAVCISALLICCCPCSYAQQDRGIVRFLDAGKGMPLGNVIITDNTGVQCSQTDTAGYAVIPLSRFNDSKFLLAFCPGYQQDTLRWASSTVYMNPLTARLQDAEVHSQRVGKLLDDPYEYVTDYDFTGNNVLVASYRGATGRKAKLFLVSHSGTVLQSVRVPDEPVSLFRSCVGNYYYVCNKAFYPVGVGDSAVSLGRPYHINLLPGMQQCECAANGNLYYRVGDRQNFTMEYGMIRKGDSIFTTIAQFEENDVARASAIEWMEIQFLMGSATPSNGNMSQAARLAGARHLWNNGSYAHINIPLFISADTLIIFDYFKKSIRYYNLDGVWIGSSPVRFEWKQSQLFRIIKDEVQNKFYVHRYGNGERQTLEEININTGMAKGNKMDIEKPYAEQVKIHDGDIYFLWQDIHNGTTRQLFIQRLNNAALYSRSGN